jgi:hypothetical protein
MSKDIVPDAYPITGLSYRAFGWVLRDCPPEYMNEHQFAVLHALQARSGEKWDSIRPTYETLAADAKMSVSTAKRTIKSLKAEGWVEILEPGRFGGSDPKANVYGIRGVPAGVRQALAEKYSPSRPGDKWFFDWCQADTSTRVSQTPDQVSEGHQSLGSDRHYKRAIVREQEKMTTKEGNTLSEVSTSLTSTVEDIDSPANTASLSVPVDSKVKDVVGVSCPGDFALPVESNPTGVSQTPAWLRYSEDNPGTDPMDWDIGKILSYRDDYTGDLEED